MNENRAFLLFEHTCKEISFNNRSYDELSDQLEDFAYSACIEGNSDKVLQELNKLTRYYQRRKSLDIEAIRDLADIFLLAGDVAAFNGNNDESIEFFRKASFIDENYDRAHHSLAMAYDQIGDIKSATISLERELYLSPGNYFSYLLLADMYERLGEHKNVEVILKKLLDRDTENIKALHKLITHYELVQPSLNVLLLRSRIINSDPKVIKHNLLIWAYHMLKCDYASETIEFLEILQKDYPGISLINLLKAHIFGNLNQFSMKRRELEEFKRLNYGRSEFMRTKLEEFEKVFGKEEADKIRKKLPQIKIA